MLITEPDQLIPPASSDIALAWFSSPLYEAPALSLQQAQAVLASWRSLFRSLGSEIENAKKQAPPELVASLTQELHITVMKTMQEQYQNLLAGSIGPVQ